MLIRSVSKPISCVGVYSRGDHDAHVQVASKQVTCRGYSAREAEREGRFEIFATVKGCLLVGEVK